MTSIDPTTPSTLPLHMARAYGVQARPVQPIGRIGFAQPGEGQRSDAARLNEGLSAGTVSGKVSFESGLGAYANGALPMYTNPAMKNAAATGVQLGRLIDAQG